MQIVSWIAALVLVGVVALLALAAYQDTSNAVGLDEKPVETYVIGIDLSLSNPMIRDEAFAGKVANWIGPKIAALGPKSQIFLRTFGSYDASANQMKIDQAIAAKKNLAEDVSMLISGVIAGVPQLIRNRQIQAQSQTNILAFLDNMSKLVTCGPGEQPVTVILASDGIEDSELSDLSDKTGGLAMPQAPNFKDCEALIILGLGQGTRSPAKTRFLFEQWQAYARAAGFKRFEGLNDW